MGSTARVFTCVFLLSSALLSGAATVQAGLEPPILRLSLENEPVGLDWNNSHSASDRFIVSFLMRGLLKYDAAAKLTCDLCATYAISPDQKVLTFELSPGETWSDGARLEPQHFVDSFRRLLDPANHFHADEFNVIAGALQPGKHWDPKKLGVRAEGKNKIEIILSEPRPIFTHYLTTIPSFPIRKEFLHGGKDSGEEHAFTAVLGPYQLAAWERGKRIVIEGNPKYTGSRPVYRVEFILGPHAQQVAKFKAGKIDILSNPTTEDVLKIPGQKMQVNPYWATRNLILNVSRQPVREAGFRRAILYGLDRDSLPAFTKSGERRATGIIPPGLPGYRELPLATQDLSRAQAERSRGNPGGKPVELELLIPDSSPEKRVAQWLTEQLEKVQIKVKTKARSSAAYYTDLEAGKFDLALTVWSFEVASPLEILQAFQTDAAPNRGKWTNVGYDSLVNQLIQEHRPADFSTLLDQASQMIEVQDVGVVPLGYPTQPFLLGHRVINFATTPFGDPDLVKIQLKQ